MVSCNMIASEWNPAFVSLKSCQIKKKDLPFLIFFCQTLEYMRSWQPREQAKVSNLSLSQASALSVTVSPYEPTTSEAAANKQDKLAILIKFRLDTAEARALWRVSQTPRSVLKVVLWQTFLLTPLSTERSVNWLFKWKTGQEGNFHLNKSFRFCADKRKS